MRSGVSRAARTYVSFFLFIRDWQRKRTDSFKAPDAAGSFGLTFLALINVITCYWVAVQLGLIRKELLDLKRSMPILFGSVYILHYLLFERRYRRLERVNDREGRGVVVYAILTGDLFFVVILWRFLTK
jgi:hypothetical protein